MSKDKHNTDDIQYEDEAEIVAEEGYEAKLKKLRKELKECQAERQEYLTGWQRARADFINLQKESSTQSSRTSDIATNRILSDLLGVLDSFDMAMKNQQVWEAVDSQWRTGVEYIYQQLRKILEDYGVERIDNLEAEFDPSLHEPLETVPVADDTTDGQLLDIIQAGYKRGDTILRAAKVKIASAEIDS